MPKTYTPFRVVWFKKIRANCCPEWQSQEVFGAWVSKYRTHKNLRRKDASQPYSPGNCYWSSATDRGDTFRSKVIALRVRLSGETPEVAASWFGGVSHQRRYKWLQENSGKVAAN